MSQKHYVYEFRTRRVRRSYTLTAPLTQLSQPDAVAQVVRHITKGDARETMILFLLDTQYSIIGYEIIAIGGLASVDVHPRELFRPAIVAPANSIVIAHNHPSNSVVVSDADITLTQRIKDAGDLLGIPLLDHVIVTDDDYVSLFEQGLCPGREKAI